MCKKTLCCLFLIAALAGLSAALVTIGTATTFNDINESPCPYAISNETSTEQYLVTAAELLAAGGIAGNINSVAFNVGALNDCGPMQQFRIRIGTTALNELGTEFVSGLTLVHEQSPYQPVSGWNTHSFNSPYPWDGSTNLVIQASFRPSIQSFNPAVFHTSTAPHIRTLYQNSLTINQSFNRPNLILEMAANFLELPHTENFNGTAFPNDWTCYPPLGDFGGWSISQTNYAGGSPNEALLHAGEVGAARLISPKFGTSGINAFYADFLHSFTGSPYNPVTLKVQYSHDLVTWHDTDWLRNCDDETVSGSVSARIGNIDAPFTWVAWTLLDEWSGWSGYWYLDNIVLRLPFEHDVGVTAIWNLPEVTSPDAVFPYVTVFNLGLNTESFNLRLRSTDVVYNIIAPVNDLQPGEERQFGFTPYIPAPIGVNTLQAEAYLTGDLNAANNQLTHDFACIHFDNAIGYGFAIQMPGASQSGLVTFSLEDPDRTFGYLNPGEWPCAFSAAEWYNGNILAIDYTYTPNRLYSVDPATGLASLIGSTGIADLRGLAWDPANLILYGGTLTALHTLDPATGTATLSGSFGIPGCQMHSLAYSHTDNILYGVDIQSDALYNIDPVTGVATLIGPLGINMVYFQELAYDQYKNNLFLAARTPSLNYNALFWIDTQTGKAYQIGLFPNDNHLYSIAIPCGDLNKPEVRIESNGWLYWEPVPFAAKYRIWSADDPYGTFSPVHTTTNTGWPDPSFPQAKKFFRVTASTEH